VSKQSIIARTRLELRDQAISFEASTVGDGEFTVFELPVEYVRASDLVVTFDGSVQGAGYTVEEAEGIVRFTAPPADGTEIYVQGYHYTLFVDDDVETFVDTAFLQHTHGRLPTVVMDGPPGVGQVLLPGIEEYLVSLLAQIEGLWVLVTEAAQGFDVLMPDGVTIPASQAYSQLMQLLMAKKAEYTELAQQLNVGLYRIQMFNLRRVSRSTNRLVPVYVPQEYDDRTFPVRVLPPIDTGL
jgi:hypothetical protein